MKEILIKNIGTKDYELFFQELSDLIAEHCYSFEIDDQFSSQLEPPVMQKQAGTDSLLKKFMKDHNCRLSHRDKWLVRDDATAVWHVYQQEYHKKVKQILTTEDLQEALSLLSA